MLKWVDETRRRLSSVDSDSPNADTDIVNFSTAREERQGDSNTTLLISNAKPIKNISPVQRRRRKNSAEARRRHSSCGQLYASPDQIVLSWNACKTKGDEKATPPPYSTSTPPTPTEMTNKEYPMRNNNTSLTKSHSTISSPPILTKPELLQIASKQSDKNHYSFWKNLMGKKSWPSRTYKSPQIRKSHSVVETYRKIEESYFTRSDSCGEVKTSCDNHVSDYGLSDLVISPSDTASVKGTKDVNIKSSHSLKSLRKQSDTRRPKFFIKKSSHRNRSPDSGFSDIRLSMSTTDDFDTERDSGVPGSPTLSSSSSSSDDSSCFRK
ncbi:uncharacterized protein [Watersipora subatra]|uniref:uncharacterized protein n=1 Tax=Watersipora subatra TaxID=2589382 RepID=UPI00355B3164